LFYRKKKGDSGVGVGYERGSYRRDQERRATVYRRETRRLFKQSGGGGKRRQCPNIKRLPEGREKRNWGKKERRVCSRKGDELPCRGQWSSYFPNVRVREGEGNRLLSTRKDHIEGKTLTEGGGLGGSFAGGKRKRHLKGDPAVGGGRTLSIKKRNWSASFLRTTSGWLILRGGCTIILIDLKEGTVALGKRGN